MSSLSQYEADTLLKLEKHYREKKDLHFPTYGGNLSIPLCSDDGREEFILSIRRSYIELRKNTFQTRTHKTIILARIDIAGPPHRNPDGKIILCPHLHLYREGYNDKWAEPLPNVFRKTNDTLETLNEFMDFCTIVTKPNFYRELFT